MSSRSPGGIDPDTVSSTERVEVSATQRSMADAAVTIGECIVGRSPGRAAMRRHARHVPDWPTPMYEFETDKSEADPNRRRRTIFVALVVGIVVVIGMWVAIRVASDRTSP